MKGSLFSYPLVERLVERQIHRAFYNMDLWDPIISPMHRTFLLYGQKGAGIFRYLSVLLKRFNLAFTVRNVTRDAKDFSLSCTEGPTPILIIRNGHLLKYHRELYSQTLDLKGSITSMEFAFIIVIGKEFPEEDHLFYSQFDEKLSVGFPPREDYFTAYDWYLGEWARHWPYSKTLLSAEDRKELVYMSAFCLPRDVKLFMRRIFKYLRDSYPEERPDLTLELIKDPNNGFIFSPQDPKEPWCITQRPVAIDAHRFNPSILEHFEREEEEEEEPNTKRIRTEVDFE